MVLGAVGVVVLVLLGGVGLFMLDRGSATVPQAAGVPITSSALVPNSELSPDVLLRRAKEMTSKQHSVTMGMRLLQPYYAYPIEFQLATHVDHGRFEAFVNLNGQAVQVRSTAAGVFGYDSNQLIGVNHRGDAGGHWVRFTNGVAAWRNAASVFTAAYTISHVRFQGPLHRLVPRHRDHQLVVGLQGRLLGANRRWNGTLWVSSKTLLPVQYVVHKGNVIRAQFDFSQWGSTGVVRTPGHWVDSADAPPALPGH